jgi:cytochrome P450
MPIFADLPSLPRDPAGWEGNAVSFTRDPLTYMNALVALGPVSALVEGGNGAIMYPDEGCDGTVFVFGHALNRQVLTSTDVFLSGPIIGPVFGEWKHDPRMAMLQRVGTGLFSLNGAEHQRQRRLIQPAFHKKQIEQYHETMVAIALRTMQDWQPGEHLDFQREMFAHTLTVAGLALFGQDFSDGADHLGNIIQHWLELIPLVAVSPTDHDMEEFLDHSRRIDEQIRDLIDAKRSTAGAGHDVLGDLVAMTDDDGGRLTENELIGHINILLTAGHETTANALSWTIFLLAQHPDVMAAVSEEIDRELGAGQMPPSLEQLGRLTFLDRVIRESMRLVPPVTIGARVMGADADVGGYSLRRGTEIVFSHYHTHHDPAIYADADAFRPDRWLTIQPDAYQYLPFSAGTKMCIGAPFALLEIKTTLAMLFQRFSFRVQDGAHIDRLVWVPLRPNHMPIILHPRSARFDTPVTISGNILDMMRIPHVNG